MNIYVVALIYVQKAFYTSNLACSSGHFEPATSLIKNAKSVTCVFYLNCTYFVQILPMYFYTICFVSECYLNDGNGQLVLFF